MGMHKLSRNTEDNPQESVYLIRITPIGEPSYYKIGRTAQDLMQRFLYSDIPSWVRVAESKLMSAKDAVLLESTLHGAFRRKRFKPQAYFGGWSECFNLDVADVDWVSRVLTHP